MHFKIKAALNTSFVGFLNAVLLSKLSHSIRLENLCDFENYAVFTTNTLVLQKVLGSTKNNPQCHISPMS